VPQRLFSTRAPVTSDALLGSVHTHSYEPRATIAIEHQVVSEEVMYKRAIAM